MATDRKTLQDIADESNLSLSTLMSVTERELGKSATAHTRVTKNQERLIIGKMSAAPVPSPLKIETAKGTPSQLADLTWSNSRDVRPINAGQRLPDLGYTIWYHDDVDKFLSEHTAIRKRTNIALQQIIAFGRTNVIKGCSDTTNHGWFRSPLGGGGGMHYYLWWAPAGSRQIRELGFGTNDVVIRAIRHHDNHAELASRGPTDYMEFGRDWLTGKMPQLEPPWTHEQRGFIESDAPIRLASGNPGSGKTTVLWKAVDTRADSVVLYATWSRLLTDEAEKHFKAFASADSQIVARDFAALLGQICGRDIERKTLREARADFMATLPRGSRGNVLGPWQGRETTLFAEVRSHLIGDVITGFSATDMRKPLVRLSPATYQNNRGKEDELGMEAATAVLRIVEEVEQQFSLEKIFPELQAAWQAVALLQKGGLPAGFERITRIVVDEIQDLTLLELCVFTEMCLAIAKVSQKPPILLLAGDEGQTVRPSGFEFARVSRLLNEKLKAVPKTFHLEESVRYPARISRVINNASLLYKELEKDRRPRKQKGSVNEEHRQAQLFHVAVEDQAVGAAFLRNLIDLGDVKVVVPGDEIPEWILQGVGEGVLSSSEAKGLEYQTVCVVDPGRRFMTLGPATVGKHASLDKLARRTEIDQLRVALSRASETLVFVDVAASDDERERSKDVLVDSVSFSATELLQHLAHPDVTPEERVVGRINDAKASLEERPARAWQLACQAFGLLGKRGLHNGVDTRQVRVEAAEVCLTVASRILADGIPLGISRQEMDDVAGDALQEIGSEELNSAFQRFAKWTGDPVDGPFDLLEGLSLAEISAPWLRSALSSKSQQIRSAVEAGSRDGATAVRFAGNVEAWLKICGYAGDVTSESANLRRQAVDALLNKGAFKEAETVLVKIVPADPLRFGRLREAQEQWEAAAREFERGGAGADALRNWRATAKWHEATRVARASAIEDHDLEWLSKLELLLHAKPAGLADRLRSRVEENHLNQLARQAQVSPSKRGRSADNKVEGTGKLKATLVGKKL